jgi:hypothetical protein
VWRAASFNAVNASSMRWATVEPESTTVREVVVERPRYWIPQDRHDLYQPRHLVPSQISQCTEEEGAALAVDVRRQIIGELRYRQLRHHQQNR